MDRLFRTMLYILFAEWSGCQIILDIQPKVIQLGSSQLLKIRCSIDLDLSNTTTVYSIMIKKRGDSLAVLFEDGSIEMTEPKYSATGSVSTGPFSPAFLELWLGKVTCSDKGEYSCSMAVRRLYKSMQIATASRLQVTGRPSSVSLAMTPDRPAYTDGEVVNITCSVLKNTGMADLSWVLPNQMTYTVSGHCVYNESECTHMCRSSTVYAIARQDAGGSVECRSGEVKNEIQINMSHSPSLKDNLPLEEIDPNFTTSFPGISQEQPTAVTVTDKGFTSSSATTQSDHGGTGLTVLYVLVSVFAVILVFTMLHLFLSDRKCKCPKSSSNSFSESHLTRHKTTGSKIIIIHSSDVSSVPSHKDMGSHEAAYLHPERPADSSVLQNENLHSEPVYEEIE